VLRALPFARGERLERPLQNRFRGIVRERRRTTILAVGRIRGAERLDDAAAGIAEDDLGHPFVADGLEERPLPLGRMPLPRRLLRSAHATEDEGVRIALLMLDGVLAELENDQVSEAADVALLELRRALQDRARLRRRPPAAA